MSVQIYFNYWYYNTPSLQLPCLLRVFFSLPHSTTYRKYWIYQVNSVKFIMKLCTNHNTLSVKRATYQKSESLRLTSFKDKQHGQQQLCLQYSVLNFLQNDRRSFVFTTLLLHTISSKIFNQKSVPSFHVFFTSLFHTYLFIKLPLQSALTLPSSISQQFFTSLFNLHQKLIKGVLWGLTLFWFFTSSLK